MWRLDKSAAWLWQNFEKFLAIAGLIMSFALPAWALHASNTMAQYAPFSWIAAGFAGALIISTVVFLCSISYKYFIVARRTSEIIARSSVNTLEDNFDKKIIRLLDFYNPEYLSHRNKGFRNCKITGPGLVYFGGLNSIDCEFKHTQIVIVKPDTPLFGVTSFQNVTIINSSIVNLTMLMNRETYDTLPQDMKDNITVINETNR